jgi:zinc transport system substrate-binding protein
VVVWVGEGLENFLVNSINTLAPDARQIELLGTPGLNILPFRELEELGTLATTENHGHGHDAHDHDKHGHDAHDHDEHGHDEHDHDKHGHDAHDHDEHGHDAHDHDKHGHDAHDHDKHGHDAHDHEETGHDDHAHHDDSHHGHNHGEYDPHVWLSIENTMIMVDHLRRDLSYIAPAHAATFERNADRLKSDLNDQKKKLTPLFASIAHQPFMVYHDAYQYLEAEFTLRNVGALHANPEVLPSAGHIRQLRKQIVENNVKCVLSEPQFSNKLTTVLIEGLDVRTAAIDPLGAEQQPGPGLYQNVMDTIANTLEGCLRH